MITVWKIVRADGGRLRSICFSARDFTYAVNEVTHTDAMPMFAFTNKKSAVKYLKEWREAAKGYKIFYRIYRCAAIESPATEYTVFKSRFRGEGENVVFCKSITLISKCHV